MVVAGMLLTGSSVRIVTLVGTKDNQERIAKSIHKLELSKDPSQDDVSAFVKALDAFCAGNLIDKIVINKRATSGMGAGGCMTFRLEGIILAASPKPIELVHNATIRATDRKPGVVKMQRPDTKELRAAYDLAYEGL